jgi:hypothetical protein
MTSSGKYGLLMVGFVAALSAATYYYRSIPDELPLYGDHSQQWLSNREKLLARNDLIALYTFQDQSGQQGVFADVTGRWNTNLKVSEENFFGAERPFNVVEGRWPWKNAVALDQLPLERSPIKVGQAGFSFSMWFRHHGSGMRPGPNLDYTGNILALGDGVWAGWKLALMAPSNALVFELGQPKPQHPVGVASANRVPPRTWTHVAGTWDGKTISIFINGFLSNQVPYDGEFFQVKPFNKFRIGFVGNGLGSASIEVDELALFDSSLNSEDVFAIAWPNESLSEDINRKMQLADRHIVDDQWRQAAEIYDSLSDQLDSSHLRTLFQLRTSQCYAVSGESDVALQRLTIVQDQADVSDTIKDTAKAESLAILEGVSPDLYPYKPIDEPLNRVDAYPLTVPVAQYDRAMDQFTQYRNARDATVWMSRFDHDILPLVKQFCVDCHDASSTNGDIDLSTIASGEVAGQHGSFWDLAARRIEKREMPPADATPLSDADRQKLVRWMRNRPRAAFCEELATEDNKRTYYSQASTRRLNRLEFTNAYRDLLGVGLSDDTLPPSDGAGGEGFDNVADVLFTSTSHMDTYLKAASESIDSVIGNPDTDNPSVLANLLREELKTQPAADNELAIVEPILTTFARHAWRRPLEDREVANLIDLFTTIRMESESFQQGLKVSLQAVLVSPNFLFVVESERDEQNIQRLTTHEIATRMAFTLWASIPDQQLMRLADSGKLNDPQTIRQQTRRMLDDPKSNGFGEAFGVRWLGIDESSERVPDAKIFPEFSNDLKQTFREETIRFVTHVFRENRPPFELIDADYVWANDTLAEHYQLATDPPSDWQLVKVASNQRGGVMTLGSVLTATSYASRTSPVLRGKWVMERLLGTSVPQPPPTVPSIDQSAPEATPTTFRSRLERHRSDPQCMVCHQTMDPLGFALENYDAIGRWRDKENGVPVDSHGELPDGTELAGPEGLKQTLVERRSEVERQLVRKLLGYSLGKALDEYDQCVVDRCIKKINEEKIGAREVLEEIFLSFPFQHRYFHKGT